MVSLLGLVARIPTWGRIWIGIGTCPVCHGLVDSRAEAAHLWWHENGQPADGQPKVGRHRV